jgi:hypothetical protein
MSHDLTPKKNTPLRCAVYKIYRAFSSKHDEIKITDIIRPSGVVKQGLDTIKK